MNPDDLTPQNGTEQPTEEAQIPEQQPNEPAEPQEQPQEPASQPKPEETVDYWKDRYNAQAQENIVLDHKVKEYEARRDFDNDPTDSELQSTIPDWDLLEPWQKQVAKDAFIARRDASALRQENEARKAEAKWNTDLEFMIAQNPSLQGKEQQFKDFASKPSRRGVEAEILVSAFLHQATATPSAPNPKPKQPSLEPGSGGPRTLEKPKLLSPEALKDLRNSNPEGYRQYVKTHDVSQIEL